MNRPLRMLFVKERMAWPRASGHDVHTFHMMQALSQRGHEIALASMVTIPRDAVSQADLAAEYCFQEQHPAIPAASEYPSHLTKWQDKFRNYWGVDEDKVRWVAAAAAEFQADTVVVSGLNVLPYLGCLPKETRKVWYAADEWVWHHLSQVHAFQRSTWSECKPAMIKGIYQRAYASMLDRVWVVSQADARAFRWFAGISKTDVIPNGVDADYFHPGEEVKQPNSCVFWGRLDFGPNIQALEWFSKHVWPALRARVPEARFNVFGFQPTEAVKSLLQQPGIELKADLPDIRSAVCSNQVVVLPFTSGGGIKNKLLEAAALSMPVLCTPRVVTGLNGKPPFPQLTRPQQWVDELVKLWKDEKAREEQGRRARTWVREFHTWNAAAEIAEKPLLALQKSKIANQEEVAR